MFGFSESADIGHQISEKNGNIFGQILRKVLKLELLKMLIDYKNTSVFFQEVSGKSS